MKKTLLPIFLLICFLLVASGIFYYKNLRGVWPAVLPPISDITNLIPGSPKPALNQTNLPLHIPDGFSISIYAKNLVNPRDLILDSKGVVLVSITSSGKVVAMVNGVNKTVVSGLNHPQGLAFSGGKLYVAETDEVAVYDYNDSSNIASNKKKIIDLPGGGGHFTRSLLISNGKLFVSIGSSCNVCNETDSHRASIWSANLDGSDFKLYASGLRNSVFMIENPTTHEIWATEMGRDLLGDDIPPDEINVIHENSDYGWPYCYGNKIVDSETNPGNTHHDCRKTVSPLLNIQAHSAPLGLAFFKNNLLVSYHGSWNRTTPTGYKVVRFVQGKLEDFITGWLTNNGKVLGRPVDILVNGNNIYISDDKAGVIYLVKEM